MGSGRGDRNQTWSTWPPRSSWSPLQWGPVVVTGISQRPSHRVLRTTEWLQWGPVVVTEISSPLPTMEVSVPTRFNGVRSW